jgi:hypothetical protein
MFFDWKLYLGAAPLDRAKRKGAIHELASFSFASPASDECKE